MSRDQFEANQMADTSEDLKEMLSNSLEWLAKATKERDALQAQRDTLNVLLRDAVALLDRYREKAALLVIQTGGELKSGEAIQVLVADYDQLKRRIAAAESPVEVKA